MARGALTRFLPARPRVTAGCPARSAYRSPVTIISGTADVTLVETAVPQARDRVSDTVTDVAEGAVEVKDAVECGVVEVVEVVETETPPAGPALVDLWTAGVARVRATPAYRSLAAQTLTGPGGVVLAVLLTLPAVLVDLVLGGELGRTSVVGVLVACVAAALAVRPKALATVAVLPPLLVAGAVTSLAWLGGRNDGPRQLVLDAGTTLAFSAPELFGVTALTTAVVLCRLAWHLVRR